MAKPKVRKDSDPDVTGEEITTEVHMNNLPEDVWLLMRAICIREKTSMRKWFVDWIRGIPKVDNTLTSIPRNPGKRREKLKSTERVVKTIFRDVPAEPYMNLKVICVLEKSSITQKYITAIKEYVKTKGEEASKYVLTPEEVMEVRAKKRLCGKGGAVLPDIMETERAPNWEPIPDSIPIGEYLDSESETPEEEEERLKLERWQLDLEDSDEAE